MEKWILSFVFVIGALMFTGAFSTGLEEGTRTYVGDEAFNTIEEALAFQEDVVKEAISIEAEIRECNLTKQSPPTISFVIVAPAIKTSWLGSTPIQFPYGERVRENVKWGIISYYIFAGVLTTIALLLIWTKRGRRFLTEEKDNGDGSSDGSG
jgi:hypothetical protein